MESELLPTHAYVAYAWVLVYAQREIALAEEFPRQAPPGFAELRREMLEIPTAGSFRRCKCGGWGRARCSPPDALAFCSGS